MGIVHPAPNLSIFWHCHVSTSYKVGVARCKQRKRLCFLSSTCHRNATQENGVITFKTYRRQWKACKHYVIWHYVSMHFGMWKCPILCLIKICIDLLRMFAADWTWCVVQFVWRIRQGRRLLHSCVTSSTKCQFCTLYVLIKRVTFEWL